jgi:hypothetical protein
MIDQSILASTDQLNHGLYTDSRAAERALNAAIIQIDISQGFEESVELFDTFYADNIKATSDAGEKPVVGKAKLRAALLNFLIPLHIMSEVGGLSVLIGATMIPGDAAGETHSAWTLELIGTSGRSCILNWRTFRKWEGAQVIYEHHYDQHQSGGPLTLNDLSLQPS